MKRVHRAWAVCLGCTLMLFVCGGLCVNAFSVTQPHILRFGGFTNTQTSLITTIRALSYLVCMLLSPAYFRLLGCRRGGSLAVLLAAASFAVFGLSRTLAGFYFGAVLAGLGYGFGSMVPATILISRWFHQKKGLALGLCAASTGLAMLLFSPILTALCEQYGLSVCFFAEAAFCVICAGLTALLLRESPERSGLEPYGEPGANRDANREANRGPTAEAFRGAAALGPARRMLLYAAMMLLGAVASPGPAHLMILFTTAGLAEHAAAAAVSLFGLMLMLGKCVYGAACDRIGAYRADWLFGAILCAGIGLCALADLRSAALAFAGAALYGAGVPLSTVGLSVWADEFGGEAQVARLVQRFQLCYGIGSLLLSAMPGAFADRTGSYAPAYAVLLAGAALSLLAVQSTYRRLGRAAPPLRRTACRNGRRP